MLVSLKPNGVRRADALAFAHKIGGIYCEDINLAMDWIVIWHGWLTLDDWITTGTFFCTVQ
jgi:hypothetical protein